MILLLFPTIGKILFGEILILVCFLDSFNSKKEAQEWIDNKGYMLEEDAEENSANYACGYDYACGYVN